ncbi:MAG: PDZ domain-containing protein [Akkermansiaceae bacterium]
MFISKFLPITLCLGFGVCCTVLAELPAELISGLASEDFKEREKAQANLLEWAEQQTEVNAAKAIFDLRETSDDPEVQVRSFKILRKLSDQDYLSDGKGYLGIMMLETSVKLPNEENEKFGIQITSVIPKSAASTAGLKIGDLIIALNGKSWDNEGAMDDFMETIAGTKPLQIANLTIYRKDGKTLEIPVKLGKRPVENLSSIRGNLETFDEAAKDKHFKEWLKQFDAKN